MNAKKKIQRFYFVAFADRLFAGQPPLGGNQPDDVPQTFFRLRLRFDLQPRQLIFCPARRFRAWQSETMKGESFFRIFRLAQTRRLTAALTLFLIVVAAAAPQAFAHMQPTTVALLDVAPDKAALELQIPLTELELAFGHDVSQNPERLLAELKPKLTEYLLAHVRPTSADKQPWTVQVAEMRIEKAEQTQSGPYQEITVRLVLTPPDGNTRNFTLNYDVIMHQVVTHTALVSIRSDWETGIGGENPVAAGVVAVDTATTQINPLEINLGKGDWRTGFKGMVRLGMRHIGEGTDHLLFLFALLLPAPLAARDRNWGEFGGSRYAVKRLLKIVTAFTVGHSITLLVGATGFLRLPQQPIEVLIAVSILVSAVHAVRPIFPGKEMFVAAGFGLIHGLAFADGLSNLNLGAGETALSILGFNLGIELMQLFVVALVVPWLILLSRNDGYRSVRWAGAAIAAVAAVGWIAERISGVPNRVGGFAQNAADYAHFGILLLAAIALFAYARRHLKGKNAPVNAER